MLICGVTPYNRPDTYLTSSTYSLSYGRRQEVPLEHWYLSTTLYVVTRQKIVTLIFYATRISNIIHYWTQFLYESTTYIFNISFLTNYARYQEYSLLHGEMCHYFLCVNLQILVGIKNSSSYGGIRESRADAQYSHPVVFIQRRKLTHIHAFESCTQVRTDIS